MTIKVYLIFVLPFFIFTSCQSQTTVKQKTDTGESTPKTLSSQEPNFNYLVEAPEGWTIRDTIMQGGLKIRLLFSPKSLQADFPAGNVLITWMDGQNIDDFTNRNINYLKANMSSVVIFEKGNIDSTAYGGQWYTYSKEQNGIVRDMINYIIPFNGFAYMITCGCNEGSIKKYRATFDKIAKSFRLN